MPGPFGQCFSGDDCIQIPWGTWKGSDAQAAPKTKEESMGVGPRRQDLWLRQQSWQQQLFGWTRLLPCPYQHASGWVGGLALEAHL